MHMQREPNFITPEIEKQAEMVIYLDDLNRRFDTNAELARKLQRELSEFNHGMRSFPVAEFLYAGIEAMDGDCVYISVSKKSMTRSGLLEAMEAELEEQAEERAEMVAKGEDPDATGRCWYTEEIIARTRAWLTQSDYALWKRVMKVEDMVVSEVKDNLLAFMASSGPDMDHYASKSWSQLVWEFDEDQKAGKPDRVLWVSK